MRARPRDPQAADERVQAHGAEGREFLIRRGQLLAVEQAASEVWRRLEEVAAGQWKAPTEVGELRADKLVRFELREDVSNDSVVIDALRATQPIFGAGVVAPNYVYTAAVLPPVDELPVRGFVAEPQPRYHGAAPPRRCDRPATLPKLGVGRGRGSVVGVIDTGIGDNPWLDDRRQWVIPPGGGAKYEDDIEIPGEDPPALSGHGTMVAGLILRGAPAAELHAVRVMSADGFCNDVDLAEGVERLLEKTDGALDVLNLSIGGYADDHAGLSMPLALLKKLRRLSDSGTVVVAAAGNYGREDPFWPAAYKDVIGVGAVMADGDRESYSNFGYWVDACTQGTDLVTSYFETTGFDGFACGSGTSFSTAIVTGAVAALQSDHNYSAKEAADRLLTARNGDPAPPAFPLATRVEPPWN